MHHNLTEIFPTVKKTKCKTNQNKIKSKHMPSSYVLKHTNFSC